MTQPTTTPAQPPAEPPKPTPPAQPQGQPQSTPPEGQNGPSGAPNPPEGGSDQPLGEPGLKALQAERDQRALAERQLAEAQAKIREFEQAGLTEAERTQQALAEAQRNAETATERATRLEVAYEKGVPAHLLDFVTGKTKEEVEASVAKVMAAFTAAQPQTPPGPSVPRPDPGQGSQGQPATLDAQIAEAEAKGDVALSISLKNRKAFGAQS